MDDDVSAALLDVDGTRDPQRVSVVVPVFNEQDNLSELLRRLGAVLDGIEGEHHEVVVVDDGSRDGSAPLLRELAQGDPRIVIVELSRNFGHQMAVTAGLHQARGDLVVVMDGDLQDAPEEIPRFIEKQREGYDVIYAQRIKRKEGLVLRGFYSLAYRLIHRVSDISIPPNTGDFALLTRRVVDELNKLGEHHRYVRGLRAWVGFPQVGLTVERARRGLGKSKYKFSKLVALALDGVFSFSLVPLRLFSLFGLVSIALASGYAVYAVWAKLFHGRTPQGFTALIVAIVFLSGVQLTFLGVLGEYVGRVYEEVKRRPHYVIRQVFRRDR